MLCITEHDGLEAADVVNVGTVRVWGAGKASITTANITEEGGSVEHKLTVQHNPDTEVRERV